MYIWVYSETTKFWKCSSIEITWITYTHVLCQVTLVSADCLRQNPLLIKLRGTCMVAHACHHSDKIIWQKIFTLKKLLARISHSISNYLTENFRSQKNFDLKRFRSQKNFDLKKFSISKNFRSQKFFDLKNFSISKNFHSQKIAGTNQPLGRKNFSLSKNCLARISRWWPMRATRGGTWRAHKLLTRAQTFDIYFKFGFRAQEYFRAVLPIQAESMCKDVWVLNRELCVFETMSWAMKVWNLLP